MGYEKFFGISVDIFTRFSCERFLWISADFWVRFLGISADFLQNCYLRTDFAAEKAWLISRVQDRVATFPFKASVKGESNPAASLINLRLKLRIPRNRWRPFLSTGQGNGGYDLRMFLQGNTTLGGNPHAMVIYFLSWKYTLIRVNTEPMEPAQLETWQTLRRWDSASWLGIRMSSM